ncbi:MAG: hypothetical protein KF897_01865 [Opitutaceae bacterium]|nr:hypothetical protein [Opitutaceae bacterium]
MDPRAQPERSRFTLWLALIVAVFAAVRWVGMTCDLWLDEIWSLGLVRDVKAPWEILTRVLHDNNHPLNSLWLWLLPPTGPAWTFRFLSWVAGALTVLLAGLVGRRLFTRLHPDAGGAAADVAGLITAVLAGSCHLLGHYASEARGYAPAVAAALLAVLALLHRGERGSGRWVVVYALAAIVGLLAHLVTAFVLVAGFAWTLVGPGWKRGTWRAGLKDLLAWHGGPGVLLAAYYVGFVRRLSIGGGPDNPLLGVLGDTAAFTFGVPAAAGLLALAVALLITVVSVAWIARRDRGLAVFFLLGAVVLPLLGPVLGRFQLLFPRYFIISATLVVMLAGYVGARAWRAGFSARLAVVVALALVLAGNAGHSLRLAYDGRGQYRAALQFMADASAAPVVAVTADADFRNRPVLGYHAATSGLGRRVRYVPEDRVPRAGVEWFLVHRLDGGPPPAEVVTDRWGHAYQLAKVFPHAPLSGWDWAVYRRLGPQER